MEEATTKLGSNTRRTERKCECEYYIYNTENEIGLRRRINITKEQGKRKKTNTTASPTVALR